MAGTMRRRYPGCRGSVWGGDDPVPSSWIVVPQLLARYDGFALSGLLPVARVGVVLPQEPHGEVSPSGPESKVGTAT